MARAPLILSLSFAAAALCADSYGTRTEGDGWEYIRLGNPRDVATGTRFGILFEGGGADVDAAYRWMCEKANGGDFLVIRASGNAGYNPYIYGLCPSLNSVATLIIHSRAGAAQAFVKDTILKAEALFLAGGDQARYVEYYTDSPMQTAIHARTARGVPIGGTSAGNAILARFGYSGITGSVTSEEALRNPFTPLITIEDGLLNLSPLLADKITDDHFVARNRMGRLITFMARIIQDGSAKQVSAIATDEGTAFLMEADGSGKIAGSGAAYFLRTAGPPEACRANVPLTYRDISVYRAHAGDRFNIDTWTGTGGAGYTLSAIAGTLQSSQAGGGIY